MFKKRLIITFCLLLIFSTSVVYADERMLSFDSDIRINQDGSLIVEETIQVRAEGIEIKRGIYRDFPTKYKDAYGNNYIVDFMLLSVMRDGKPESYHTKNIADGIRIYIGDKDIFLPPGVYKYTISYKTDRQLGFFQEHDELYWNVTGNFWSFPIERATSVVRLPDGAQRQIKLIDAFTGPLGAKGKDFKINYDRNSNPVFQTTRVLGRGEGLTIVVGWQKGFVAPPSPKAKAQHFVGDNREIFISFFGLCFISGYYLLSWLKVGKDPEKDVIFPLYEPPAGYSPASMRYIYKIGYDDKSFASALINMAVKGAVTLKAKGDGGIDKVQKTGKNIPNLTPDEKVIYDALFSGNDSIAFETSNSSTIRKAIKTLKTRLQTTYEKIYFFTNKGYFLGGLIGSFAVVGASIFMSGLPEDTMFLSIWLAFWSIGVTFLLIQLIRAWKSLRVSSNKLSSFLKAIFFTAFSLPFMFAEIFVFITLIKETSFLFALMLFALGAVNYLFYHLLKAPTLKGRKLMDKIEGFRLFLDATERDRLNMLHAPHRTPELFEKYLPYAVALDVENKWAEQFESVLKSAATEDGRGYTPRWYSGSFRTDTNFAAIGGAIGDAIAASVATAASPGSSSGSGGSSGGGGGGGGGGGW
jgi:hypothetical protein